MADISEHAHQNAGEDSITSEFYHQRFPSDLNNDEGFGKTLGEMTPMIMQMICAMGMENRFDQFKCS